MIMNRRIAGSHLLAGVALLAACNSPAVFDKPATEISDAVTSAISNIAQRDTSGPHLGFDTYSYPGDAAMLAWRDESVPYEWVGYYLEAPCHKDNSWTGKRQKLEDLGWGVAVIYVGEQTWGGVPAGKVVRTRYVTKYVTQTVRRNGRRVVRRVARRVPVRIVVEPRARQSSSCNRQLATADRGARDGDDAISRAEAEGFPHGSVIFLDIERMEVAPSGMREYYRAWTRRVLDDGRYRPGFYAHTWNASLIHGDVSTIFLLAGHREDPPFWIAGGSGFSNESQPEQVGHAFANVWQGVLDVARTYSGIKLPIDISVARFSSPSARQNGE
jgi:Domain of unknown function (DUF1906)